MSIMRIVIALIVGLAASMVAIVVGNLASISIWPLPETIDVQNMNAESRAALEAHIAALPPMAKFWMAGVYGLSALLGGFLAGLLSRALLISGLAIGLVLTALAFLNVLNMPMALWIKAMYVLVMLPCALVGARVGQIIASR